MTRARGILLYKINGKKAIFNGHKYSIQNSKVYLAESIKICHTYYIDGQLQNVTKNTLPKLVDHLVSNFFAMYK